MRSTILAFVTLASTVLACSSGGDVGSGEAASSSPAANVPAAQPGDVPGVFQARLVDAPTDEVTEIVVTVTKVTAHSTSSGWQTIGETTKTVDLLKLQNGTFASLGVSKWPAGTITQFRLYVSEAGPNYVTTPDGAHHPLTVPSGEESGIKFKGGFTVDGCSTGFVTFDFDGKKSIFTHPKGAGAGDEWLLRPVVRLKSLVYRGTCGSGATTGGTTTGGTTTGGTTTGGTTTGGTATGGGTADGGDVIYYGDVTLPDTCAGITCNEGMYCSNGVCATLM